MRYTLQEHIGRARYVVNFHDGTTTHADGSPFYDVRIFHNRRLRDRFVAGLGRRGYRPA